MLFTLQGLLNQRQKNIVPNQIHIMLSISYSISFLHLGECVVKIVESIIHNFCETYQQQPSALSVTGSNFRNLDVM